MNPATATDGGAGEVERALRRCDALRDRIRRSLPSSKISPPCRLTLLRLLDGERNFLCSLHFSPPRHLISPNVGYLESVFRVIQHPAVRQVSRVCKPVPHPAGPVHIDIVCTLRRSPAWILVSDRNPLHISWSGPPTGAHRGVQARVDRVLAAARSAALSLRPVSVVIVFASGIGDDVAGKILEEFGAEEVDLWNDSEVFEELADEWVGVSPEFGKARVFEIRVGSECSERALVPGVLKGREEAGLRDDAFGSLVSSMGGNGDGDVVDMVNFDTTALVAMVSGISNGGTESLMKAPEDEMRQRFKGNYEFVMRQVMSELRHPLFVNLKVVIAGKRGIICQSVYSEFNGLVSMCGGPKEKLRANQLVKHLLVVPDSPSERVMDLPTTRKIALKNKIVFGTADYWHAPTLTANMGFVRAISQTGMSLLTIEHSPRALSGD